MSAGKFWTIRQVRELEALAAQGMRPLAIAERLGRSYNAVRGKGWTLGIFFGKKGNGRPRAVDWDKARRLASEGFYVKEAAREMGVHHTTLLYIAKRAGFAWLGSHGLGSRRRGGRGGAGHYERQRRENIRAAKYITLAGKLERLRGMVA